jgi:hypothetical protein
VFLLNCNRINPAQPPLFRSHNAKATAQNKSAAAWAAALRIVFV